MILKNSMEENMNNLSSTPKIINNIINIITKNKVLNI